MNGGVVQEGPIIDHVQHTQAALKGHSADVPIIAQRVWTKLRNLQIADAGLIIEHAIGLQGLTHMHQINRPIVIDVIGHGQTRAVIDRVIEVVLNEGVIIDRLARRCSIATTGTKRALANAGLKRANNKQWVAGWQLARFADMTVKWHLIGASDIVDIAALLVAIDDQTRGQLAFDDWHIDEGAARSAFVAALGEGIGTVKAGVVFLHVRLVGDVTHGAAHGAGAKQGALWASQNFDALQVNRIDVQIAARHGAWRIVQIERDIGLRAGGAGDLQAGRVGGQAANIHGRGAGALRGGPHVWQILNQLFEIDDVQLLQRFTAKGLNGQGDLVDGFFAAGCRHDDVFNAAIRRSRCSCLRLSARNTRAEDRQGDRGG